MMEKRKEGERNVLGMIETLEHSHLVPYDLLIPFGFFLQRGLQHDLAFDVPSSCQRRNCLQGWRRAEWRGKSWRWW